VDTPPEPGGKIAAPFAIAGRRLALTHASSTIAGLRGFALEVPELAPLERFFTEVWHLGIAARTESAIYCHATGNEHLGAPVQLAAFLDQEHARWEKAAQEIGLLPE
jgi:hypothetical protein